MSINKINYSEYITKPNEWSFPEMEFSNINLIVGKNSSGKTRMLNVIDSLSRILKGKQPNLFITGNYELKMDYRGKKFDYIIEFRNREVLKESLIVDGVTRLSRIESGEGKIWYEKEGKNVDFELPKKTIAAVAKRDKLQHSYLIDLYDWAKGVALYRFGTDLGKEQVMTLSELKRTLDDSTAPYDPNNVVATYSVGYTKFKKRFDNAIIKNMKVLGYDLTDISSAPVGKYVNASQTILGIVTTEKELGFEVPQFSMSQGMYRALVIIINLVLSIMSKNKTVMLIDDIGEGLDFERSSAMIDLLIKQCKKNKIQLIMTSNDRFVMNKIPLEYWSIIKRDGREVQVFNEKNSPKQFSDYKYMGINNFDFFASDFFAAESTND